MKSIFKFTLVIIALSISAQTILEVHHDQQPYPTIQSAINEALTGNYTGYVEIIANDYNLEIATFDCISNEVCSYATANYYYNNPGSSKICKSEFILNPDDNILCFHPGDNVIKILQCYGPTEIKTYTFPNNEPPDAGWKWFSFDILNEDPLDNIASELLYPIRDFSLLDHALFKDHGHNTEPQRIEYLGDEVWLNGDHPITSPYGYKFRTLNECYFTVFGERCESTTTFELAGENEENWIGYFLLETQHVYDAFAGQLDNLTKIMTQHWAIKRGSGWPDVPYTLSPGDMVIAYCEHDVPEFSWNFEESREKYVVPESQDFTFEEEADYIPVFISLDPQDLPSEIGAFVDGECKGATVVQDTSAQICSYILENQGQNLTFEFSYGNRGQNKRIEEYIIYEPETSKKEKGCIQIDTRRDCYYVSFKGDLNDTPAKASIEINNYPNPFNPETRLTFSLPNEQEIELTVYNLKGQKVRLLVSGQLSAGKHSVVWEGKNDNEKPVGSGLYFYKLRTEDKVLTKKMLLLK